MEGKVGPLLAKELYLKRTLAYLPNTFTITTAGMVILDNMTPCDVDESFRLVKQARDVGLNVSEGEFETRENFEAFLDPCLTITIRGVAHNELKGVIVLNPTLYIRAFIPRNAAIFLFLSSEFVLPGIVRDLLKIVQNFVRDAEMGYTGCLFPVFPSCEEFVTALSLENFHSVAVIPNGGRLASSGRLVDQFVYFKQLGGEVVQIPPIPEWTSTLEEVFCQEGDSEDVSFKPIPSLPVDHLTSRHGVIRLRNGTSADVPIIYQMVKDASINGIGYGMDEALSERLYRKMNLEGKYCLIVENPKGGTFLGFVLLEEASWVLRANHGLFDSSIVLSPNNTGVGLGGELGNIVLGIGKDLGFTGMLTDTDIGNHRGMGSLRKHGLVPVGVLPHAATMAGPRPMDVVLLYRDLKTHPSFITDIYSGAT